MSKTEEFAPYVVATKASPDGVEVYVLTLQWMDKLDEALASDKALRVATINRKLACHPAVDEAIECLAEAIGMAVNQLAMCMQATGYKPLDRAVDTSNPH